LKPLSSSASLARGRSPAGNTSRRRKSSVNSDTSRATRRYPCGPPCSYSHSVNVSRDSSIGTAGSTRARLPGVTITRTAGNSTPPVCWLCSCLLVLVTVAISSIPVFGSDVRVTLLPAPSQVGAHARGGEEAAGGHRQALPPLPAVHAAH